MSRAPSCHRLLAHPATPAPAVRGLQVTLAAVGDAPATRAWLLRYALTADWRALRLPQPARAPGPADGLWRHSCFEAFVGTAHGAGYHEFNFSPSGHWAAYAFDAERQRAATQPGAPAPRLQCTREGDTLTLSAWLPLAALPTGVASGSPVGLSAVIEAADGHHSYWALAHPPGVAPDFHHRAGWTARAPA